MSIRDPFAEAVRTVFGYYVSPARVEELRERAGFKDLLAAAVEIDRLLLVIESAVRFADPKNHPAVLAALKANHAATAKATSGGRT